MGTTIQEIGSNDFDRYTYIPRVLVIDGYTYTPEFMVWIMHAILLYCAFLYGIQISVSVLV